MSRPTSPKEPLKPSQALLALHPLKRLMKESTDDYAGRVTTELLRIEEQKAKEAGEPWSDDPAEQWVSEDTASQAFKTWGSDPLGLNTPNPYAQLFLKLYQDLTPSPLQREKKRRDDTLRAIEVGHGRMSREEALASFPAAGTPQARAAQAVWQKWADDEPLYSPHYIYKLFDTTLGYNQWKKNHNLPDLLTYRQTIWLLKTASSSERFRFKLGKRSIAKNLCKEDHLGHLFETGERSTAAKTKVGRKYGSIKLLECLSEDETTSHNANVYYKAVCEECGYEFPRFNYRHVSRPCPECTRLSRVARAGVKRVMFRNPVTVYSTANGSILMSPKRPPDAVAYAVITQFNEEVGWVSFTNRQTSGQSEPARVDPQDFTLDPDKLLKKEDLFGFN